MKTSMFPLDIDTADYEKTQLGFQIADRQARLTELNHEIYSQVAENQEEFLSYISEVQRKGELFSHVKTDLSSLEDSLERLKFRIRPSYQALNEKVKSLELLQSLGDTLRLVIRYSQLVRQLHLITKEIDSSAMIAKIENLLPEELEIEEIQPLRPFHHYVKIRKHKCLLRAKSEIEQGLRRKDASLLASGLSIIGPINLTQELINELGPQQSSNLRQAVQQQVKAYSYSNSSAQILSPGANPTASAYTITFWTTWSSRLLP